MDAREGIIRRIDRDSQKLVEWRRHFHRNPELSFQEFETAAFIRTELGSIEGLEVSSPTPTSVVARLVGKGTGNGGVVALRADIDALPVEEEKESEYRSLRPGVMHACGHDGHATMLLGAAGALAAHADGFSGEIRFVFQHAEEKFPGGASEIAATAALDGVEAIIGAHLMTNLPAGAFGIMYGPASSSPGVFTITVKGKGGHSGMPQLSVDPIVAASALVGAFQSLVSRNVDPLESVVVSVTQFEAGSAPNIIPDGARIGGSVRTFSEELAVSIPERMRRMSAELCAAYGATCEFKYERGYASVVNDEALLSLVEAAIVSAFGAEAARRMPRMMGSEDFSAYTRKMPGAFFLVGAGDPASDRAYPNHHPRFDIDERALPYGAKALALCALAFLDEKRGA